MRRTLLVTWIVGIATAALVPGASAQPEGAVVSLVFQQSDGRRLVVGASTNGVVILGEDLGNFRAFRSSALSQRDGAREFFWVDDIDQDREDEFVFGGNPSFVLDGNGDPLFGVLGGCDDFFAGNLLDDDVWELFCRRDRALTVWNFDGQFLWEYSVTGMRIGRCEADDVDSDERLEFGCSAGDAWLLVDIANDEPVQEVGDNPAESGSGDPMARYMREAEATFGGERRFDVDGDGSATETLHYSAGVLNIRDSDGVNIGTADLPDSALYSAAAGDLNGDGTPELFVGGADTIYVISPSGEILSRAEANPSSLERDARVTVQSAAANGLEDSSSETVRAAVSDGLSSVQRCYDRQMGSNQFVRVGSMFYELDIDGSGRVDSARKIHSSVANRDLEDCVENALESMRFSPAAEASGSVSVRLNFDFVDR